MGSGMNNLTEMCSHYPVRLGQVNWRGSIVLGTPQFGGRESAAGERQPSGSKELRHRKHTPSELKQT